MRDTEERSPLSEGIDERPLKEILEIINAGDRRVPELVAGELYTIAEAVKAVVETVRGGGRVFFAGAGTSGRLGVIEAAELPATFGVSSDQFRAIMAGGPGAVFGSIEGAEDDEGAGGESLEMHGFGNGDLLVALSASGRTPFVLGALGRAKQLGASTVALTCNSGSTMEELADIPIVVETGPEVVAGSTRMRAGTAQKLLLNMLTTAAMIRLGRVHDGYMIGIQATSKKLKGRATRIVGEIAGVAQEEALEALETAGWDLKVAVLVAKGGLPHGEARRILGEARGSLRLALEKMGDSS